MVSFQIQRGLEANLPKAIKDGKMYFCTDTGNLFIDHESNRIHVNANKAKALSYYDTVIGQYVDMDAQTILEIIESCSNAYVQADEPENAPEGALWVDVDEEGGITITVNGISPDENGNIELDIPSVSPTPYALKFVGAATGSYDGQIHKIYNSQNLTIMIELSFGNFFLFPNF